MIANGYYEGSYAAVSLIGGATFSGHCGTPSFQYITLIDSKVKYFTIENGLVAEAKTHSILDTDKVQTILCDLENYVEYVILIRSKVIGGGAPMTGTPFYLTWIETSQHTSGDNAATVIAEVKVQSLNN